jgi:hypothetical protein
MSDGVFIKGRRPASKKAIKEALATAPETVSIECTSMFGNGFSGTVSEAMPEITFAGPCPHTSRKFYGQIGYKVGKGFYCK